MRVEQIRVEFTKTVSDGSYGNERHMAGLTVTTTADDDGAVLDAALAALATVLEGHVNSRFKQSRNDAVRYAMESSEEREARYKREAEERKARLQQERAEREARLAAQAARDEDAEDEDEHETA